MKLGMLRTGTPAARYHRVVGTPRIGHGMKTRQPIGEHPAAFAQVLASPRGEQCVLWDEDDVAMLADMVERVHRHGALAGVQFWYGGYPNYDTFTRELPPGSYSVPVWRNPDRTQEMTRSPAVDLGGARVRFRLVEGEDDTRGRREPAHVVEVR